MNKIVNHKKGHHYSDQLDGVDLFDGEELILKWPDGSIDKAKLKVVERHCHRCHSREAYFVSNYRGSNAWSRLLGFEAERPVA